MSTSAAYIFHAVLIRDIGSLERTLPGASALIGPSIADNLLRNPDTRPDSPCLFCLVDGSGQVVCWIRAFSDQLSVDGDERQWLWTGDLTTLPEFRRRGLATRLQRESTKWALDRDTGRGSVFSTDETLHIYRKLGYLLPGHAARSVLIRSVRPIVEAHVTSEWAKPVARAVGQPVAGLANKLIEYRCRRWTVGSHAELCQGVTDPAVRAVLSSAERWMPVRFSLTPAKLQWKIEHSVRRGAQVELLAIIDTHGAPLAFAVLRTRLETKPLAERYRDFRCTTLMDFVLAEPSERAARVMVAHVCKHFLDSPGGDVLQLISYDAGVTRLARQLGALRAGRGMSFACVLPQSLEPPGVASDISKWPVTHFSGDGPFI